ncbi:MAG: CCA tRNA nucleotidyltransferase [Planctomycetaceae bacterium]|nr:CCA tRNA nucleotidyltransferase [Planctomycetaceae bacterium]
MAKPAPRETAIWVVQRLVERGFQALFAGGCVRDMLLEHPVFDYDVATNATPDDVQKIFPRVLLVGAKFGVAMVLHRGRKVEVTTFRSDASYSDGRRPDAVTFTSAREDAQRRDFTINGMFYDPLKDELIDYVGGQDDLRRRIIRTIGRPEQRFGEDYLRMLRAARFSVRLGFAIESETAQAIRVLSDKITAISGERIFEELSKMLVRASAAEAMDLLIDLNLAQHIFPDELTADESRLTRARQRLAKVAPKKNVTLALAALLAETPPKAIRACVRRWGASNELRDELSYLAARVDGWQTAADTQLADFKFLMGSPYWPHLQALWHAQEKLVTGRFDQAKRIADRATAVKPEAVCPPALITGADLHALGVTDGPTMGKLLRRLYEAQLNEEFSTRQAAMEQARRLTEEMQERES